jgi:hypothetical protein
MQGKFKEYDCYDDVDEKCLFFNLQQCVLLSMGTPAMVKKLKTVFTITIGNWQI